MKILMLNHEFPPVGGGAAPVTFELCKHLVRKGHRVDVVTMHYDDLPRFETVEGVNIYRTPAIRKRPNICYTHELATYVPGALMKTLRLARRIKYDVIHCHFIIPGGPLAWLVSKSTGIPFLITCHGTDVPGHNPDRFDFVHRLITPAWRFLARSSSVLTSPSESLKTLIIQNCPDVNVRVIPNGIYTDKFKPVEKTKSILMCSRIFNFKGFQYAIEAVRDVELDWQVNVVGEGPYLPELKQLAEGSKTPIKFWGWLDKTDPKFYDLFKKSSIFVFPSAAESFGLVVSEAMAAGNAIIASDIPAHRELLGDAGLFVQIGSAEEIHSQLQRLIGDKMLCEELGRKALTRVCERFDWDMITEQYVDCYQMILSAEKQQV
jgi:glycosyltransferase involved in cell wall biosynthesis